MVPQMCLLPITSTRAHMHAHARSPPPALLLLSKWITSIARCSYSRTQIGFSVFCGVFSSPWPHQRHQEIALCREEDLEVTRASLPTRVSLTRTAQVRIYMHIYVCVCICLLHISDCTAHGESAAVFRETTTLAWLAWCICTCWAWWWHASLTCSCSCTANCVEVLVLMLRWRAGLPRDWWISTSMMWAGFKINLKSFSAFAQSQLWIAVFDWPLLTLSMCGRLRFVLQLKDERMKWIIISSYRVFAMASLKRMNAISQDRPNLSQRSFSNKWQIGVVQCCFRPSSVVVVKSNAFSPQFSWPCFNIWRFRRPLASLTWRDPTASSNWR